MVQSTIAHNLNAGCFSVEFGHGSRFHRVFLRVLHFPATVQRCVTHLIFQIVHCNEGEYGSEDMVIDGSIKCF